MHNRDRKTESTNCVIFSLRFSGKMRVYVISFFFGVAMDKKTSKSKNYTGAIVPALYPQNDQSNTGKKPYNNIYIAV